MRLGLLPLLAVIALTGACSKSDADKLKHDSQAVGHDVATDVKKVGDDPNLKAAGSEFIRVLDQEQVRPDTMARVQNHVVEHIDRIDRTLTPRPFLAGAKPYIGTQWKVVSRRFCEFVCHDPRVDRYKDFYRNTFIADEAFFQTVMMNTSEHGKIVNDDLRTIDWVPDGDIKLRPRTFTLADAGRLLADKNLFARKFDASVDDEILGVLERSLLAQDRDARLAPTLAEVA